MRRVLLVGAGEVGGKHLDALAGATDLAVAGIADPAPRAELPHGVPVFGSWESALAAVSPELVIVAVPPGAALTVARAAAANGAAVLVEKPVVLDPAALTGEDEGIFVGFQPHFAPGLDTLLADPPMVERAEVRLAVRRDAHYFQGWRCHFATAGGVLHQQAVHGLALALRLMPGDVENTAAVTVHGRELGEMEDGIAAVVTLPEGRAVIVDARIDHQGPPHHEVTLHLADGRRLDVRGRNLEAGLGDPAAAPTHEELRRRMYTAVLAAADGGAVHPCLFPLSALRRPLEVIDRVYRDAHVVRAARPAAV
ncbi:Gfo/Idh/MocA family oxidoreductase [Streptomyces acidiscabies]|uniref:Gfo/Idh/MocA family oxidoreductase n=1 Tax=Streptomyces acidiscabies TaxID=42234 RepID=A0AAP6EKK1_9ACTN|nr:Gfo/Idh/MocA family oxidoreductase [Streptomyces acidiscabies]MBP5936762.1 gfo/Idh/MocA family oxidoreductase [Streptomyces sp. LBUM 1476]MDX2966078.1 Gfo/Idh/MocA family oxidoreductase [Streptomyces acidiscabies]MDX3021293.1 Gfo/Idh/MocA family oxidoreductase [Streptomyces acidiscabies]MDX3793454.1 Gfo/Idh/MocA family oxidoreductase [Streptomyces acidiscabies]GAQ54828.1 oxidoreductase family, NAD-binding Rossmann [Streptomyces acidiscabies]